MFAKLQVQLPKGLFKVEPFFQTSSADKKRTSIAVFKAARSRLPKA